MEVKFEDQLHCVFFGINWKGKDQTVLERAELLAFFKLKDFFLSNQEICKNETFKFSSDYTIKTLEQTMSLEQDDQVIRLLDSKSLERHK